MKKVISLIVLALALTACPSPQQPPPQHQLIVTITGDGEGTVTGPGIACADDCTETYPEGTLVTLTATPAEGSLFTGWAEACAGQEACELTMDGDRQVTAIFALLVPPPPPPRPPQISDPNPGRPAY